MNPAHPPKPALPTPWHKRGLEPLPSVDTHIEDCQRMIDEQFRRISRQMDHGIDSTESRLVLKCLQHSLIALKHARVLERDPRL